MAAATSATQDHYEVLGVARTCDADTLKAAWRVAARRTHPDAGGTAADFERAHQAWQVLADPLARAEYDRHLRVRERVSAPRPTPATTPTAASPAPTTPAAADARVSAPRPASPSRPRNLNRAWRLDQAWRSGLLLLAAAAACVLAVLPVNPPDWFVHIDALTQAAVTLDPWTPLALALLGIGIACWIGGMRGEGTLTRAVGLLAIPLGMASLVIAAGPLLLAAVLTLAAALAIAASFVLAARVIFSVLAH